MDFLSGRWIVRRMLAEVGQRARERAMESVHQALMSRAHGNEVRLTASDWLVTARR